MTRLTSRVVQIVGIAIGSIIIVTAAILFMKDDANSVDSTRVSSSATLHSTVTSPLGVPLEIHTYSQGALGWDYIRIQTPTTPSEQATVVFKGYIENAQMPPDLKWITPTVAEIFHIAENGGEGVFSQFDLNEIIKNHD